MVLDFGNRLDGSLYTPGGFHWYNSSMKRHIKILYFLVVDVFNANIKDKEEQSSSILIPRKKSKKKIKIKRSPLSLSH